MSVAIADLKTAVDFRALVMETHELDRSGKVLCPAHADTNPSCHIYPDHFYCFPCGAHGDAVTWLELAHGLSTKAAIQELERRAGVVTAPAPRRPKAPAARPTDKSCAALTVPEAVLTTHLARAERLSEVPEAMQGRGFTLSDLRRLEFAAENGDAIFPVYGPDGAVLALKRRRARACRARYVYLTTGHGTPAWCSWGFGGSGEVLIVEGEANAMACWLARPELCVMGVAGSEGDLHLEALRGRTVNVYADGDEAGRRARDRWAAQAGRAGARVFVLEPWEMDACEIAGKLGRAALREQLT